jgi:hypothetical protein
MRITKYIHSCLLFELNGQQLLFDPGKFSFNEGLVQPDVFKDVATVIITHDHPDHLDVDALQRIVERSGAIIISNGEVAAKLKQQGLAVQIHEEGPLDRGAFQLQALPVRHEAILDSPLPQMTAWLVNGRVLNPADSFAENLLQFAGGRVADSARYRALPHGAGGGQFCLEDAAPADFAGTRRVPQALFRAAALRQL